MITSALRTLCSNPFAPTSAPGAAAGADTAAFVAGLIANLVNRAADTGGFRGAIPAHPGMSMAEVGFRGDEGHRPDLGMAACANATSADINVESTDARRLGFLAFNPIHKQAHGFDPDWKFEGPDAAMTAFCHIAGIALEVRCDDHADGSATITLQLAI